LVNSGEGVIYPVPSWNNNHYSFLHGAIKQEIECKPENSFFPTIKDIDMNINDKTSLICICSPQNPTGRVIDPKTLKGICELIVNENKHRANQVGSRPLYLFFDQIYSDLSIDGSFVHPLTVCPEIRDYLICVDGVSKSLCATGIRVGWVFGPQDIIGKMTEVSLFTERKEIIKTDHTTEAKTKLLKTLAQAIANSRSISTDKKRDAESLLAEITGETIDHEPTIVPNDAELTENEEAETPPTPTPQNGDFFGGEPMHSIPDNQSSDFNERILNQKLSISDMETPPLSIPNQEGEGVSILHNTDPKDVIRDTPPIEIGSHTALDPIPNANWKEV
jgi:hypothetical protein